MDKLWWQKETIWKALHNDLQGVQEVQVYQSLPLAQLDPEYDK